jgi:hypothetical protein
VGVEVDGRLQAGLLLGISGESVELVEVRLACACERAPGGGGARRRRRAAGERGERGGPTGDGGAAADGSDGHAVLWSKLLEQQRRPLVGTSSTARSQLEIVPHPRAGPSPRLVGDLPIGENWLPQSPFVLLATTSGAQALAPRRWAAPPTPAAPRARRSAPRCELSAL